MLTIHICMYFCFSWIWIYLHYICIRLLATMSICLLQVVVEKKLMNEKHLTRHDIGREEFVAEVSLNCNQLEIDPLNNFDVLKVSEYVLTHSYCWLVYCCERFGNGKKSMGAPFYSSCAVWVLHQIGPVRYGFELHGA